MALLDKIIWQIETNLPDKDITIDVIADRCAVSGFHMCRVFRQNTGFSIMSYMRGRRLSLAARSIADSENTPLSIAFDAGYGSHQAFTRAFAGYFGVLPSTVRKVRSVRSLSLMEPMEMKKEMIVNVAKPEIRDRAAFRVVGLGAMCSFEDTSVIPPLWSAFNARHRDVSNAIAGIWYGVCCDADDAGRFRYVAGLEAAGHSDGMEHIDIPAGRYAVFSHKGHIADLPKTVYTIWNQSLTDLGLTPEKRPDFERYDSRFDPETGRGVVEIWIPIA
ncbi:MAG: AraC family transcriptional regulator [Paracoccus sp. (in: a-proteobacteria)]|uniref:AraC family transcriptional regulator n=1 Tax=Paracoccus sp. TaxID=267 RepID=UPI0026DF7852|nr:AraC family transcriptional regulator [Paracoccus sp. (in: a-proteobacteria)]MDO5630900.1 AraC family transcriptional regulator [Paracoccus sp. (in: a-proteobacteria)]